MATGIVKMIDNERSYGLLFPLGAKQDADLILFHFSQIIGPKDFPIGAEVRFQKVRCQGEHPVQAAHVELLEYGGRRTVAEAAKEDSLEARRARCAMKKVF